MRLSTFYSLKPELNPAFNRSLTVAFKCSFFRSILVFYVYARKCDIFKTLLWVLASATGGASFATNWERKTAVISQQADSRRTAWVEYHNYCILNRIYLLNRGTGTRKLRGTQEDKSMERVEVGWAVVVLVGLYTLPFSHAFQLGTRLVYFTHTHTHTIPTTPTTPFFLGVWCPFYCCHWHPYACGSMRLKN